MRFEAMQEILKILEEFNFNVLLYEHSCFDIAAQNKKITLLIKILENIDGFRKEHADELKKLSSCLKACPLIIGEKSKADNLLNNTIYDRYEIPVITIATFQKTLLGAYPERIYSQGRVIAEINGEELKSAREKSNISIDELAEKLELTKESIYLYEHDKIRTKYEIAKKIENFLNTNLITPKKPFMEFDLKEKKEFDFDEKQQTGLGKKLMLMDFDVSSFDKMNFDLLAHDPKYRVIIKQELTKNPEKLLEFSDFFKTFFAVVSEKESEKVPIIHEKELKDITCKKDFLKLLKEKN